MYLVKKYTNYKNGTLTWLEKPKSECLEDLTEDQIRI